MSAFHKYTPRPTILPSSIDTYSSIEQQLRTMMPSEESTNLISLLMASIQSQQSDISNAPIVVSPTTPTTTTPFVEMNKVVAPMSPNNQTTTTPTPPTPTTTTERSRRKRTTFSSEQATRLEQEYLADCYMAREKRQVLAIALNLSENQVKTWFQNRRAKDKRDRKTDNSPHNSSRKTSPSRSIPSPNSSTSSTSFPLSIRKVSTPKSIESITSIGKTNNNIENEIKEITDFNAYLQSLAGCSLSQTLLSNAFINPIPSISTSPNTPISPEFNNILAAQLLSSFQMPLSSATI